MNLKSAMLNCLLLLPLSSGLRRDRGHSWTVRPTSRKTIFTPKGDPRTKGPFSSGVQVNNMLFISGQIGLDPATKKLVKGGVKAQTKQALKNMATILKAASCTFNNVVKTTVLLKDIEDYDKMNEVYRGFFEPNFPARMAYQVAALPLEALVEIEAIASVGRMKKETKYI